MRYEKRRSPISLTLEYGVILVMLRNMIQISWNQGRSCVDLSDIQMRHLDTSYIALKKILIFCRNVIFMEDEYLLRIDSGSKES